VNEVQTNVGYNYLFTVDGRRISNILDISKVNKVLIAGKEKNNIINLWGFEIKEEKIIKENEEKNVKFAIKQAWAQWFEQNEINIDNNFWDVDWSRKTAKMHIFDESPSRQNFKSNSDLKVKDNSFSRIPKINLDRIINNEEILVKIIENTIWRQEKIKYEKQFYDSLKSKGIPKITGGYCYKSKGVNPPSKEFKSRQPRFIKFKIKPQKKADPEKPLFDDTILSEGIKNKESNSDNLKASISLDMIKQISESYNLTRRQVFEIHSQYKAMIIPLDRQK